MIRKQKTNKGSKYGIDAHRKCKSIKKRMMQRFLDENEQIFEDYKQGKIY
jgi:hypothetical protein